MSKCITVLSLIVLQLWSSSGEIHPDVQRFVSSRSTALKGFRDGYKGENSSRLRDFSEGLDTYKYVQMISDRDVLRRTLGSSMLRNIYIKQTRLLLSKKVINLFQQSEQGGINNVYRYTLSLLTTGFLTLAFFWRFFFRYITHLIYSNQLGTRAAFSFCFILLNNISSACFFQLFVVIIIRTSQPSILQTKWVFLAFVHFPPG